MTIQCQMTTALPQTTLSQVLRRCAEGLLALFLALALTACTGGTTAQKVGCIIASNDGPNGFRTDEISNCRLDVTNGNSTFVLNQKQRSRSYASLQPLMPQYREAATYWLTRAEQLPVPAATNPAGFNARAFLQAASQASSGFVLIRDKNNGGRAVNVVFITNGIYRSIDFPGTDIREMPSGFLMTR